MLLPLLQGPARVVLVSVEVLEAVVLVPEADIIALDLVNRVILREGVSHLLPGHLAVDKSLSDQLKVKFVFIFRKASVLKVLVASIYMKDLVDHHNVLLPVLVGILRKASPRGVLLGSLCVITGARIKRVLLVISASLNMLKMLLLVHKLNKHNLREMQGLLTALPLTRIFRRGGP